MSAIQGQPAPKPQSTPDPDLYSGLEEEASQDLYSGLDAVENIQNDISSQPMSTPQQETPFLVENLPTIGGIVGGTVGGIGGSIFGLGVGGTPGAIGGAALGGAAGAAYRDLIETHILGKKQKPATEVAQDIGVSGAIEGAGQAIGMGVMKVGEKVISAVLKSISEPVKEYMKNAVKSAAGKIEEPLMKIIASQSTDLNTEAAGNLAKDLLKKDINGKYGKFIQAYSDIEEVSKNLPVADEARRKFTVKLKDWALNEFSGDNYTMVKKFADQIDAAGNGKQIDDVIKQITDAQNMAYNNKASNQAKILKELKTKALDFMDDQTTSLAKKIQSGKATPQEVGFLNSMLQQRGVQEADPSKYAKSLANDFLKSKDMVREEYSAFKAFLEDVGEQTRVSTKKSGPTAFLDNIMDVPSEKLIERMFDPKNAAALRRMQGKTPEVFDIVRKSKMSQILQKSSPDGNLDLASFRKNILALPDSTRNFLMTKDSLKVLNEVVDNPRLKRIKALEKAGEGMIAKWVQDVVTAAGVGAEAVGKSKGTMSFIQQGVGSPIANQVPPMIKRQQEK